MSISVIIPAYNASRFIAETLNNVLSQTLSADEIIVVDDGSTDDTAAIAESFGTAVKVFRRPNMRQGASRNFGVQNAQSEWIAFIDADDLWAKNKLERQMQELAVHPEADVCYTGRVPFREEEGKRHFGQVLLGQPAQEIRETLYTGTSFFPSSTIIRRSTFLSIGGFRTDFLVCEDWDLWLRLFNSGAQFASCPEPLHLYRAHESNVTGNVPAMCKERGEIFREHILPHLSGLDAWSTSAKHYSFSECTLAYYLREKNDPHCLPFMLQSIRHWPFGDLRRYKVGLHMLLTRAGLIGK